MKAHAGLILRVPNPVVQISVKLSCKTWDVRGTFDILRSFMHVLGCCLSMRLGQLSVPDGMLAALPAFVESQCVNTEVRYRNRMLLSFF